MVLSRSPTRGCDSDIFHECTGDGYRRMVDCPLHLLAWIYSFCQKSYNEHDRVYPYGELNPSYGRACSTMHGTECILASELLLSMHNLSQLLSLREVFDEAISYSECEIASSLLILAMTRERCRGSCHHASQTP